MQHSEETMFSKQIAENIQMFVQHLLLPGHLPDIYHCIKKHFKNNIKHKQQKTGLNIYLPDSSNCSTENKSLYINSS